MMNYLKNKFESHNIKFLPLIIKNELEGVLISTQDISADVAEDFSLMSLVYSLLAYESQPRHLDIEDSLTGFYNKVFYQRLLEREIERARVEAGLSTKELLLILGKQRERYVAEQYNTATEQTEQEGF